jgi:hypothetical protein
VSRSSSSLYVALNRVYALYRSCETKPRHPTEDGEKDQGRTVTIIQHGKALLLHILSVRIKHNTGKR